VVFLPADDERTADEMVGFDTREVIAIIECASKQPDTIYVVL
jgi:hypothetical protein